MSTGWIEFSSMAGDANLLVYNPCAKGICIYIYRYIYMDATHFSAHTVGYLKNQARLF